MNAVSRYFESGYFWSGTLLALAVFIGILALTLSSFELACLAIFDLCFAGVVKLQAWGYNFGAAQRYRPLRPRRKS